MSRQPFVTITSSVTGAMSTWSVLTSTAHTVAPHDPNTGPDLGPVTLSLAHNGMPVRWRREQATDGRVSWVAYFPKR